MRQQYIKSIEEHEKSESRLRKKHEKLGYGKLASLIGLGVCVYYWIKTGSYMAGLGAIILLELYIVLAVIHHKTDINIEEQMSKQAILKKYVDRIDGEWGNFDDEGAEYMNPLHPYTRDLDIFGHNSLFQFLNTTKTWHGRESFAKDLSGAHYDTKEIKERQKAIWELSASIELTTEMQFYGGRLKKAEAICDLIKLLKGDKKIKTSKTEQYLLYIPVATAVFSVAVFGLEIHGLTPYALGILGVQMIIWLVGALKQKAPLSQITSAGYGMSDYAKLFELISKKQFESEKLTKIKERISASDVNVAHALKKLNFVITKIDMRKNAILYFVLNIFLLWDYSCMYSLKKWRAQYQNHVEGWFEALGELESLLSFTNLAFVDDNICMPEITDKLTIKAENLGHPLIEQNSRINNSFAMNNEILIVSGSNMSGKTTFLRTIGVNMVLGLNGGYCCGVSFIIPNIKIISSMRIYDDLSRGVSTFYAELERIKAILELCKREKAMFLIDEIFKGTNSDDRLYGAKSVIDTLEKEGAIGLITTHDLALCKTEGSNRITNYSFCERYENGDIQFDYVLCEGPAKSANAKYLMEMLGITK